MLGVRTSETRGSVPGSPGALSVLVTTPFFSLCPVTVSYVDGIPGTVWPGGLMAGVPAARLRAEGLPVPPARRSRPGTGL